MVFFFLLKEGKGVRLSAALDEGNVCLSFQKKRVEGVPLFLNKWERVTICVSREEKVFFSKKSMKVPINLPRERKEKRRLASLLKKKFSQKKQEVFKIK